MGLSIALAHCGRDSEPPPQGPPVRAIQAALAPPAWAVEADLPESRQELTTTLLLSGDLLLAGGFNNSGTLASTVLFSARRGAFEPHAALSSPRRRHTATLLLDGKVLLVGGSDGSSALSSTELYDPDAGTFSAGPPLSVARDGHTATRLESGSVLVAGGGDASAEIFDPVAGAWSGTGPMVEARAGHAAARLPDGRVLLVGPGFSAEVFDPAADGGAGAFAATGSLNELDTTGASATLLSTGEVLVAGGGPFACVPGGGCMGSSVAELYDPSASGGVGAFRKAATDRTALHGNHTATLLPSGEVLIAAGRFDAGGPPSPPRKDSELYDPTTETFTDAGDLMLPRSFHGAALMSTGQVVVPGGLTPQTFPQRHAETFFDSPGTFTATSRLVDQREAAAAVPLRSGKLLLVGGGTATAEVFDPSGSSFTPTDNSMTVARSEHTATVLQSGQVLVVGGESTAGLPSSAVASAELYDPVAGNGSFSMTGSLGEPRQGHTATLLPTGKVLVVGGTGPQGAATSAELYDPASGTFTPAAIPPLALSDHAAVLLPNGQVLLHGEGGGMLYAPAADSFTMTPPAVGRYSHPRAFLLPTGKALIVSGEGGFGDLYDPGAGTFTATREWPGSRIRFAGAFALLPSGGVLVAGGHVLSPTPPPCGRLEATVFNPLANSGGGQFVVADQLTRPRAGATATTLGNGSVVLAGGFGCVGELPGDETQGSAEVFEPTSEASRRPTITSAPSSIAGGETAVISGTGFSPAQSASTGNARGTSSGHPLALWMAESGQAVLFVEVRSFTDTTATVRAGATALHGFGWLFISVNGILSEGALVEIAQGELGAPCTADPACASGICAGGVCCDTRCDAPCESCTAAGKGSGVDGECGTVPPALHPDDLCFKGQGAPCVEDGGCAQGLFCVDGVCCESECAGQCQACDVDANRGECVPVVGAPHGDRPPCDAGASACEARVCDGQQPSECAGFVGQEQICRASSCADGVAVLEGRCDGNGGCPPEERSECRPYACAGDRCGAAPCEGDSECAEGFRCAKAAGSDVGDCVAMRLECQDDLTVTLPDGGSRDCAPYRCESSSCRDSCGSTADCAPGFACDANGRCVSSGPAAELGEGCACRATGRPREPARRTPAALLVLAVGGLLFGRRRRARGRAEPGGRQGLPSSPGMSAST